MEFPKIRLRRLREEPKLRQLLGEHSLLLKELVQPLFVKEGLLRPVEIASMPGQFQHTPRSLVEEAKRLEALGVSSVLIFGIPSKKDASGKASFANSGVVQRAVAELKKKCPALLIITDVCLCEYMSHGHCGHVTNGRIDNDRTLATLAKAALSHARAGADVVAPSDMMDGRVRAIRTALDRNGFKQTPLISYAVKYASAFYGPFREAAESAPRFGDRRSYQMDPANAAEALREAGADVAEGADMILVKPALAYGDIISRVKRDLNCPVGAYSVSGEYAMIKAAARNGWIDEKSVVYESHLSFKRAGANFIVSYFAKDLARWGVKEKKVLR